MSCALTAENEAAIKAPPRVARKRAFIMSTAPVGGRPIDAFVDAIGPQADRPPERSNLPKWPLTHRDRRPVSPGRKIIYRGMWFAHTLITPVATRGARSRP